MAPLPKRYNRTVLFRQEESARGLRAIPFILGALLALASFAAFFWSLVHQGNPLAPYRPPSIYARYFHLFWLPFTAFEQWRHSKKLQARRGYWPKPNSYDAPPKPDNSGIS